MKKFATELAHYCMAYNKPLSEGLIRVYIDSLDYSESDCIFALNATAFELGRLPTPREIAQKIDPQRFAKVTSRQDATIVAQQIISAVRKFGANAKIEQLQKYLGEVGFEVIKNQWAYICKNMQTDEEKIWFAQFRDQAEAIIAKHAAGHGSTMPSLPSPAQKEIPLLVSKLCEMKSLK